MVSQPLVIHEAYRHLTNYDDQQQQGHLQLLQYSNAYFNPYEVKHRKRTSRAQLLVLESTFNENSKPSSAVKKALSAQLDMPLRNVQVWFQNRRAKDKHLASKARAKAEAGQDGPSGGDDDHDTDDEKDPSLQFLLPPKSSPLTATGSESESSSSLLAPPNHNLNYRRGSAPSLGLLPTVSEGPNSSPRQSPLAKNRTVSDSNRLADVSEGIKGLDDQVHLSSILGRRRSLPAFHPDNQQYAQKASHLTSLPTIPDYAPSQSDSDLPLQSFSLSSGHGGVYRSGGVNPKYGAAPYPLRGPMSYNYRSGSMPGTGVFRVPTNPNGTLLPNRPWMNGGNDDGGYDNGFVENGLTNSNGFHLNNPQALEEPFAYPPRRMIPDQVNPGPLPRADFSFGDNNANPPSSSAYQDEDTTDNDASRMANMAQSHRFGSFASDYSIESDATGTTNTTTTSSVFSPLANPPFSGGAGYRVARFGLMQGLGIHHSSYDSGTGPPISYGTGSGGPMSGGLSAAPVHFPIGFQPDMRRASCPAHFVEQFASFGVNNPANGMPPSMASSFRPHPSTEQPPLRKMSSGYLAGNKPPLGINVQLADSLPHQQQLIEENEPLTALIPGYAGSHSSALPTIHARSPTNTSLPTSASIGYSTSSSGSPPEVGTGTGQSSRSHSLNPNQNSSREATESPMVSMHAVTPLEKQLQHIHGFSQSNSASPQDSAFHQQQNMDDFLNGVNINASYHTTPEAVPANSYDPQRQQASTSLSSIYGDWNHPSHSLPHLPQLTSSSTNNSNHQNHYNTDYPVYGSQENLGRSTSSFKSYDGVSSGSGLADGVDGGYHFDQEQAYENSNIANVVNGLGGVPLAQPTFLHAPAPILPTMATSNYAVHQSKASSESLPQW
ncbi:hypothetical protein FRB96_008770 [Tulasnella sp. 330]|nr:hypothetical protein FRB96_008770 [Tulasnella sp. 330]KAG8884126.1 hypothetical protein FRB97_005109 [Tulasnella sp. 331]KAG8890200.1 hypothetical protein FRB98_000528 [Tulasnella sp. 332]